MWFGHYDRQNQCQNRIPIEEQLPAEFVLCENCFVILGFSCVDNSIRFDEIWWNKHMLLFLVVMENPIRIWVCDLAQ